MRRLAVMLVVVAGLASCAGAVIGPVDHACHANPGKSQGSGCDDRHDGGAS